MSDWQCAMDSDTDVVCGVGSAEITRTLPTLTAPPQPRTPLQPLSPATVTSSTHSSPLVDKCPPQRTVSAPSLTLGTDIHEKPPYSFPCLIGLALKASESGHLCVREIYAYIVKHFPYFLTAKSGWKNSIRHNLSLNKYFIKVERREPASAKASLWTIAPQMHEQLDRDIKQCLSRMPSRVRRVRECDPSTASPLRRTASHPAVLVAMPPSCEPSTPTRSSLVDLSRMTLDVLGSSPHTPHTRAPAPLSLSGRPVARRLSCDSVTSAGEGLESETFGLLCDLDFGAPTIDQLLLGEQPSIFDGMLDTLFE